MEKEQEREGEQERKRATVSRVHTIIMSEKMPNATAAKTEKASSKQCENESAA